MEKITLEKLLLQDVAGKVICFPTDTVYGVGARVGDLGAIERIFKMKKRDGGKPLAILTPTKDIDAYVKNVTAEAKRWMDEGWPGALTLIFEANPLIDESITKGFPTVAFRMPNSTVALTLLSQFGLMATTSVNISGEAEINDVETIYEKFFHDIDYIVTDEVIFSKKPSKIIDVSVSPARIIRS